jgi:HD-GYP domain-containing protein (c-di-GMP phosphodiesterase class II)
MLKKISVEDLKPGMYVTSITQKGVDLGDNQREGRIKDNTTIIALQQKGIKELHIDTEQGDDSEDAVPIENAQQETQIEERQLADEIHTSSLETKESIDIQAASFEHEIKRAGKIHNQALGLISNALEAVQNGHAVDTQPFEEMASSFMDSVVRNKNALACLSRIRDKDSYLMEHSVNVGVLMSILGTYLKLDQQYLHQCVTGALLHDIGKILIPDTILHKPGKLTDEEFTIMKRHSLYSQKILEKGKGFPQVSINVAGQHHERIDGKGYPAGLKGDQVTQEARMASVVDVYDAITADRVYHDAMTPSVALKRMLTWCGPHLDVKYVHAFIKAMGIYPVGSLVELENGMAGVVIEETEVTLKPVVRVMYNLQSKCFVSVKRLDLSKDDIGIVKSINPNDHGIKLKDFLS